MAEVDGVCAEMFALVFRFGVSGGMPFDWLGRLPSALLVEGVFETLVSISLIVGEEPVVFFFGQGVAVLSF